MSPRALRLFAFAAMIALVPGTAFAQRLVLSLSASTITIRSNFAGADVVLFGAIEGAAAPGQGGPYDLVVKVTGPLHNIVARRKTQVAGMWLNTDARTFVGVPEYLALLANRPFEAVADEARRRTLGLTPLSQMRPGAAAAAQQGLATFQQASIKLKSDQRLWVIRPTGVDFITPALFRAAIPIPAAVPVGTFDVRAFLFSAGELVAEADDSLVVAKSGFEEQVVHWAENQALLYGIGSAMLALLFGFLASIAFRR